MKNILYILLALIILLGLVSVFKDQSSTEDVGLANPVLVDESSDGIPIRLYYYNEALDQGPGGVQCSSKGLVSVDRKIEDTTLPLTRSIELLLQGNISPTEKTEGLTTEFPLAGLSLVGAEIQDGVATLTFDDPQNKTGGGACRTGILWAQIEATAKQFPSVQSVRFLPEELFQP